MSKGLPIAYIKKWGISKLAWQKFRQGALTKSVPTRKTKKGSSHMAKKGRRKSTRRGGTRFLGMGIKGLLFGVGGVAVVKYLTRRFFPIIPQKYEDSVALIGAGVVGKVAKIGTSRLLPAGIILGGGNLIADLLVGGVEGMPTTAYGKGYDV